MFARYWMIPKLSVKRNLTRARCVDSTRFTSYSFSLLSPSQTRARARRARRGSAAIGIWANGGRPSGGATKTRNRYGAGQPRPSRWSLTRSRSRWHTRFLYRLMFFCACAWECRGLEGRGMGEWAMLATYFPPTLGFRTLLLFNNLLGTPFLHSFSPFLYNFYLLYAFSHLYMRVWPRRISLPAGACKICDPYFFLPFFHPLLLSNSLIHPNHEKLSVHNLWTSEVWTNDKELVRSDRPFPSSLLSALAFRPPVIFLPKQTHFLFHLFFSFSLFSLPVTTSHVSILAQAFISFVPTLAKPLLRPSPF